MIQNDTGFAWTDKKERAAYLVAEDRKSDEQIAQEVGVTRVTLARWKSASEFQERIRSHVEAYRNAVLTKGIADRVNRVSRLDQDWQRLQVIRERRGEAARRQAEHKRAESGDPTAPLEEHEEYPGMMTGHIVRVETPVKYGVKVEYQIDTSLLGEMRALEIQAAKEMGQWVERKHLNVKDLTDEQIIALLEEAAGEGSESEAADDPGAEISDGGETSLLP